MCTVLILNNIRSLRKYLEFLDFFCSKTTKISFKTLNKIFQSYSFEFFARSVIYRY